jgi:single stranded DNA-binding protein
MFIGAVCGHLTADAELQFTATKQTPVMKFSIGVSDYFNGKDVNMFVDVVSFSRAEALSKILKKGMLVMVSGRYRCDFYKTNKGMMKRQSQIEAYAIQILSSKKSENSNENSNAEQSMVENRDASNDFEVPEE